MNRDVLSELRDARTIINDGCNERGTILSGERCKACVRYIDHAILLLKEQEPVKRKISPEGVRCGKCDRRLRYDSVFCDKCGTAVRHND